MPQNIPKISVSIWYSRHLYATKIDLLNSAHPVAAKVSRWGPKLHVTSSPFQSRYCNHINH